MIHPERIRRLNDHPPRRGRYVLYWMQASQRAECNHALEYAVREANAQKIPVLVFFGLTDHYPEANLRHYTFLVEGLQELEKTLAGRGIRFVVRNGSPADGAILLAEEASQVITDRGYLHFQKAWRQKAAMNISCPMIQVETDVVVPVETAMEKEAYSAAVLRPRIHRHLDRYLKFLRGKPVKRDSLRIGVQGLDLRKPVQDILFPLSIDRTVSSVEFRKGGTSRAKRLLKVFIAGKLKHYPEHRSDPGLDGISHMSPYLHFGQISPLYIATEVIKAKGVPRAAKDAYLEELIVRRELSINFVHYHPAYGNFTALPGWARQTLERHLADRRPSRYRPEELEKGLTHDPYWNAAQREMALTGSMHNTMRMYWGKKILEWSDSPKDAFYTALRLNNKYQLDGRDPNSYAGVAWCFGKHDRPWMERDIFGTVRYMNDAGLRRKFGMDRYVKKIQDLKA